MKEYRTRAQNKNTTRTFSCENRVIIIYKKCILGSSQSRFVPIMLLLLKESKIQCSFKIFLIKDNGYIICKLISPFNATDLFLYPLKTSEKTSGFLMFSGVVERDQCHVCLKGVWDIKFFVIFAVLFRRFKILNGSWKLWYHEMSCIN